MSLFSHICRKLGLKAGNYREAFALVGFSLAELSEEFVQRFALEEEGRIWSRPTPSKYRKQEPASSPRVRRMTPDEAIEYLRAERRAAQ